MQSEAEQLTSVTLEPLQVEAEVKKSEVADEALDTEISVLDEILSVEAEGPSSRLDEDKDGARQENEVILRTFPRLTEEFSMSFFF